MPRVPRLRLLESLLVGLLVAASAPAAASTPRWITGPPFFSNPGFPLVWYTDSPAYFTDPGDLSPSVNHAAADALVAGAASVWNNVVTSRINLQQGGVLAEHISGNNVYMGQNGLVFPADADQGNSSTIQIAVVYDTDGAVTDLLLGSGASDPTGCRQNAVTENVDAVVPSGTIHHAIVILNGRCTGPLPEQQIQMQYQLVRAFGRVLGLGWSQCNDNVFTGVPAPTYDQALHWPIMHPLDIICGPYTYQCLPEPFTLRDDDLASITYLYPVGSAGGGKQPSWSLGSTIEGRLLFSPNQGMAGVNFVIRRIELPTQVEEEYQDVSGPSGTFMQRLSSNPLTPQPGGFSGSIGETDGSMAGRFRFSWVPLRSTADYWQDLLLTTEPMNPLYTGAYAIAPYTASTVSPSGLPIVDWKLTAKPSGFYGYYEPPIVGAASNCSTSGDGTEASPAAVAAGGWWTGVLCGTNADNMWDMKHEAWSSVAVQANRSLTIEVTATDETGATTVHKARPVVGLWNATDAQGTPATMGAVPTAFNTVARGMTSLTGSGAGAGSLRFVIADERGDGRPDYSFQGRVMYADSISPATAHAGAQVTITGMGFRPGNVVTIRGVVATVSSWTATTIVATVPLLLTVPVGATVAEDVAVTDPSTLGTTVMTQAFQYIFTVPSYTLVLVSGPSGNQPVGLPIATPFSVKAINSDGVTPMAGAQVVFSTNFGSVSWSGCGAVPACTVTTGSNGIASVTVTPTAPGAVVLQASFFGITQTASFEAVPLVRTMSVTPAAVFVAAGKTAVIHAIAKATQQGLPASTGVMWTATGGPITFSSAQTMTDASGSATANVTVTSLTAGAQATATVCAWGNVCGNFTAVGVAAGNQTVLVPGGAAQSVPATSNLVPSTFQVTDGQGNPVIGAAVQVYQTVSQWTAPCPAQGRCPIAPVLQSAQQTVTSDEIGMIVITPLEIPGPEITSMIIMGGSPGSSTLTLQKHP